MEIITPRNVYNKQARVLILLWLLTYVMHVNVDIRLIYRLYSLYNEDLHSFILEYIFQNVKANFVVVI
jgi:hypothetical protein